MEDFKNLNNKRGIIMNTTRPTITSFCVETKGLNLNEAQHLLNLAVEAGAYPNESVVGATNTQGDFNARDILGDYEYLGVDTELDTYLYDYKKDFNNNFLLYEESLSKLNTLISQQKLFDAQVKVKALTSPTKQPTTPVEQEETPSACDYTNRHNSVENVGVVDELATPESKADASKTMPDSVDEEILTDNGIINLAVLSLLKEHSLSMQISPTEQGNVDYVILSDDGSSFKVNTVGDLHKVIDAIKVLAKFNY